MATKAQKQAKKLAEKQRKQEKKQAAQQEKAANKEEQYARATGVSTKKGDGVTTVTVPTSEAAIEGMISLQQGADNERYRANERSHELITQANELASRQKLGELNLQGIQSQSEATKFAASESAGATRFAATEAARGSIETQRVASESQERQIGLTGRETRETDLQQEMFRRYKEQKDQSDALRAFRA